jgi:PadR family transcriptional regulator PadR
LLLFGSGKQNGDPPQRVKGDLCQVFWESLQAGSAIVAITCCFPKGNVASYVWETKRGVVKQKADVLQGTLGLMVLKTLDVLGPLHGYGIARRIEQISGNLLAVSQGTLYPVLLKLEQEGALSSEWGASENNRRARFCRLTQSGRKLLETETQDWEQTAAIIARFFEVKAEDFK